MSYHPLGQTSPPLIAEAAPPEQQAAQYMASRRMAEIAIGTAVVLGSLAVGTGSWAWVRRQRRRS